MSDSTSSSLRALADARGFLIGAAVDMSALNGDDPRYTETLRREFNTCVAENVFKPSEVWIGPREYDFTATDQLADFAEASDMVLRGHTLVWHQQTPRWLSRNGNDWPPAEELKELLREYIHAIVGRYRGRIAMWDVVNEAIADPAEGAETTGLRTDSPWYRALGPDYLRLAFQWAHEADPTANLYYNDYEIEASTLKSDAVYRLVVGLKEEGAPVHGVGMQGHLLNGWRVTDSHRANVRRFADLGLDWQITEADIRMELTEGVPTADQLVVQADGYRDLTTLCLTEPRCKGLVFWGFTDACSWIPGFRKGWGAALPLDAKYVPKPAYTAIASALSET